MIDKEHVVLKVPIRIIESPAEGIVLGFRQEMVSTDHGGVSSGAGLGSDNIIVEWRDKTMLLRGSDLLAAWAAVVQPEDLINFPKEVRILDTDDEAS